jgi:hypothetical protein
MSRNSSPWSHPPRPLPAAADDDERSEVRTARPVSKAASRSPSGTRPVTRGERIEEKLRLAESLLAQLPESDSRVRLLRVAVVRRDEVLLDGILADLGRHAPEAPVRRRLSSHPRLKR